MAAAAKPGRANAVVSRALYLVPKGHPALTPLPAEQPSELEITSAQCDVTISVWWDEPPNQLLSSLQTNAAV